MNMKIMSMMQLKFGKFYTTKALNYDGNNALNKDHQFLFYSGVKYNTWEEDELKRAHDLASNHT